MIQRSTLPGDHKNVGPPHTLEILGTFTKQKKLVK